MSYVQALSGRAVDELTLEAVRRGEVTLPDLRIHPRTLQRQAQVAAGHANPQLAENLRRAAELTSLPDDEVLAIYEALRVGDAELAAFAMERHLRSLVASMFDDGAFTTITPRRVAASTSTQMTRPSLTNFRR